MKNSFYVLLVILLSVLLIVFGPLAVVWAINHIVTSLFATAVAIPYNFWSWLSIVALNSTLFYKNIKVK